MARQSLEQFIRSQLTDETRVDDECTAFSLLHFQGSTPHEVKTIKIGSTPWDPKKLASLFKQAAENYAGGIDGQQQFQLVSFFRNTEDMPQGKYPWLEKGAEHDMGGIGTEAPTPMGELQQNMRHREAWMQFTLQMVANTLSAQSRTIDQLSKANERLREENADALDLAKEVIIQRAKDEHDGQMEVLKFQRQSAEREKIIAALPVAVNTLLGREIFPQTYADSALLETIANELDEEELSMLISVLQTKLKPEIMGMLADRLTKIIESKKQSKKALTVIRGGNNDNE